MRFAQKKSCQNLHWFIQTSYQYWHDISICLDNRGQDFILVSGELIINISVELRPHKAEPQVPVAVTRLVPVAISRPAVPGVVVPAPATNNARRALG